MRCDIKIKIKVGQELLPSSLLGSKLLLSCEEGVGNIVSHYYEPSSQQVVLPSLKAMDDRSHFFLMGAVPFLRCMMTSCGDFDSFVAIVLVVFLLSYLSILCRDLMVMSRHHFLFIFFLLVATSVLRCNQFPPSHLYPRWCRNLTFFCLAFLQVATLMSGRDIIPDH